MGGYVPGTPASDPTAATLGGVYFALNGQSPIVDKSPYIYNVTTFGDGATGALVDGSVHSSGNRSMLFHTVTHIHSDGLGIWAKDNANRNHFWIYLLLSDWLYCNWWFQD